ncbi:hypothetical protein L3X38_000076 [Prunus dulcis]|uniref:Uncharacterized protein n=1 Tax=Prunus dulcis TaxID=3755 RepID=A0AAD4YJD9_PRUDU|nr:hypothetical protein L3X38_000076 [Prunus dulcis]
MCNVENKSPIELQAQGVEEKYYLKDTATVQDFITQPKWKGNKNGGLYYIYLFGSRSMPKRCKATRRNQVCA